ncbi:MAG: protein phosphatase 2C domain-containing protein [Coriobacteriia bacterium]|nr:protein phosphatase 2C domain-containing protein [Coriobacteriia bacterium]
MGTPDIRAFGASVQGSAHIKSGVVCQDAHKYLQLPNGWYLVLVADGVGSALHSDEGAQIAVVAAAQWMYSCTTNAHWDIAALEDIWLNAFRSAQLAVTNHAQARNLPEDAFDTTLTGFIYNGEQLVYGHSGDGGIVVLQKDGRYCLLTEAQKGDEANSTYVLRLGEQSWAFGHSCEPVAAAAAMTDGVLAAFCPSRYSVTDEPVNAKFATLFMHLQRSDGLREVATAKDFEQRMERGLEAYFHSDKVAAITDDKTLVVAINMQVASTNIGDAYYEGSSRDEAAIDKKIREGLYSEEAPEPKPEPEHLHLDVSSKPLGPNNSGRSLAQSQGCKQKPPAVLRYVAAAAAGALLAGTIAFAAIAFLGSMAEGERLALQNQVDQLQVDNAELEERSEALESEFDRERRRFECQIDSLETSLAAITDDSGTDSGTPGSEGLGNDTSDDEGESDANNGTEVVNPSDDRDSALESTAGAN